MWGRESADPELLIVGEFLVWFLLLRLLNSTGWEKKPKFWLFVFYLFVLKLLSDGFVCSVLRGRLVRLSHLCCIVELNILGALKYSY